jgi:hypothetical protein
MEKWKQLLSSRKFWASLVGLVLMIVKAYRPDFPLDGDQVAGMLVILISYIMGTALEDGLSRSA